jgi:hypothetical protein
MGIRRTTGPGVGDVVGDGAAVVGATEEVEGDGAEPEPVQAAGSAAVAASAVATATIEGDQCFMADSLRPDHHRAPASLNPR